MEDNKLTEEELKILKSLAQNMIAGNRISNLIRSTLLWLASSIGAGWVVWEFLLKGHK